MSSTDQSAEREHDVVVFGATVFVGKLTAAYLAQASDGMRVALAGRSERKLVQTRTELGSPAADWPLILADCHDEAEVARLAQSAKVVATIVGPYLRYGLPLVQACAAAGTHYADLTGEVLFMRRSIDTAHAAAQSSGARIAHTCGFDSIPSDIGVFLLHRHAQTTGAGDLEDTTLVVKALRGGVSAA